MGVCLQTWETMAGIEAGINQQKADLQAVLDSIEKLKKLTG